MVLIPKLTKVDEGKVCLSLLDGSWAASADSVQMRILYSPRKGVQSCLHNNIITMYFCQFSELDDTYVDHRRLLCRGGRWSTWSYLIPFLYMRHNSLTLKVHFGFFLFFWPKKESFNFEIQKNGWADIIICLKVSKKVKFVEVYDRDRGGGCQESTLYCALSCKCI